MEEPGLFFRSFLLAEIIKSYLIFKILSYGLVVLTNKDNIFSANTSSGLGAQTGPLLEGTGLGQIND